MGLINIENRKYIYVSFGNENGKLVSNGQSFDGISGTLLGYGSHEFEFNGRSQKKFDIYIQDGNDLYCVQFGFYTWVTFRLMNFLLNLKNGSHITILSQKDQDGNFRVLVKEGGEFLKWKYKMEALKLKNLPPADKELRRNQIIDKWYQILLATKPYVEKDEEIEEDEPF